MKTLGIISLIEFPIYRKYNRCSDTAGNTIALQGNVRGRFFHKMARKPAMPPQKKWGNSIKDIIPKTFLNGKRDETTNY